MKSHEGFMLSLLEKVILDSASEVSKLSVTRDIDYIKSRVACEGLRFLTETLPSFGKAILSSLEAGALFFPLGFRKSSRKSLLPAFLQGWTKRIFSHSGELLAVSDPYALQEVLQICMLFYKTELPYSKEKEQSVIASFVKNENEIHSCDLSGRTSGSNQHAGARKLLSRALQGFEPRNISPKHGPGAVATGETGNDKYVFKRKFQRLHQSFPYYEFFSSSLSRCSFESGWYRQLSNEINPVAKVTLVPKDSRGPRLISMEPLEIQWIQQGILDKLVSHIERSPITRGFVNFTDQSINQRLACESSVDRRFATIDLKDASDRVSLQLFRSLFPEEIQEPIEACRSVATKLPNGEVLPLRKFAPMGSALCFPILALTVWSIAESTCRSEHRLHNQVYVYGDDLIVPVESLESVTRSLQDVGLVVNLEKSFHKGFFRESCGMDAYKGVQVTPLRFKKGLVGLHPDHSVYEHLISLSESFFNKGFWKTCGFLRKRIAKFFGKIPWTTSSSYPGYYCPDYSECERRNALHFKRRFNKNLQYTEFRVRNVQPVKTKSLTSCDAKMLKALTGLYAFQRENDLVTLRSKCALRNGWYHA